MSFKDYIKESDEVMNLINQVNKIQNEFATTFNSLENLKNPETEKAESLLKNINLLNLISKIELKMEDVGNSLTQLQQVIIGQRTFTGISGGTEEPN
jgi:conjugal transfer/entry exclusion protein